MFITTGFTLTSHCFIFSAIKRLIILVFLLCVSVSAASIESALDLASIYANMVDKRLDLPAEEINDYANRIIDTLNEVGLNDLPAQYILVVDRSPLVQAIFLYWIDSDAVPSLIGASPVSTGHPGRFDYFETPTGVFRHSLDNLDFRAEGTKNSNGIRGYGVKGMRVFDFGWQQAIKGWGNGGVSTMRLQMHATDPDLLENRLGTAQSKGCIRIPATLNLFIDQYGLLDADYEKALDDGHLFWMLDPKRQPTRWSGRYLIVLDTLRTERPAWAPAPRLSSRADRINQSDKH